MKNKALTAMNTIGGMTPVSAILGLIGVMAMGYVPPDYTLLSQAILLVLGGKLIDKIPTKGKDK